jgi:hypothetical protein
MIPMQTSRAPLTRLEKISIWIFVVFIIFILWGNASKLGVDKYLSYINPNNYHLIWPKDWPRIEYQEPE